MGFGEKGLGMNPETGCISNEELEKRESVSRLCVIMDSENLQKVPSHTETLRDRFAMAALTGLLASCDGPAWGRDSFPLGETCYAYADQLLESRKK